MHKQQIHSAAFAAVTMLAACFLALTATPSRAQVFLDMSINPNTRTSLAGTAPQWDVILTNNTGGAATILLTAFSPGFPVTPDVTITTGALPVSTIALADGQSFSLNNFLTTTIRSAATSSVYDALAEMTYNATDAGGNDFTDLTASADWQLTVRAQTGGTTAPEPASITLLLLALPAVVIHRRKR